jgi:hypothetical protein
MSESVAFFSNLIFLSGIVFFLYRSAQKSSLFPCFFPALGIKILCGLGVGWLYRQHYQMKGDTFLYFEDAAVLSRLLGENPSVFYRIIFENQLPPGLAMQLWGQPRAWLMVELLVPFTWLTHENYWLSGIYLSVFSFSGLWFLAEVLAKHFPENKAGATLAFLFLPSVVFWTSGILKETLCLGLMGGSLGFLLDKKAASLSPKILFLRNMWRGIFVLFSVAILVVLKYYYLAVLLPVGMAYFLVQSFRIRQPVWQLISFFIFTTLILLTATQLHPTLHADFFLQALVQNHNHTLAPAQSLHIAYENLQANWLSLLRNLPLSLVSGLYRPFIWEAKNFLQLLAGVENTAVLLLSVWAVYQVFTRKIVVRQWLLVAAVLTYVCVLASLLALASPNFGTLLRYKAGFLPFLVYLLSFTVRPFLSESK